MAAVTRIEFPYGQGTVSADAPTGRYLGTLDVRDVVPLPKEPHAIRDALDNPIQSPPMRDVLEGARSVTIVVSDAFRRTCADQVLPVLLDELKEAGVAFKNVRILFSTGMHRPPTPAEQEHILGTECYKLFKAQIHVHNARDVSNLTHLGTTRRGTPVAVNSLAHESDRVIVIAAVLFHYFAGFGGGRKSIVPGLASAETIAHNHALNLDATSDRLDPDVRIGRLEGNPIAEDLLEAARMTHVDFCISTVLNRDNELAGVFAGDLVESHAYAVAYARELYTCEIDQRADIVIAAAGDTKNLVQSHKALFNAYQAAQPGGAIVLLAPCEEGMGSDAFSRWMALGDPKSIIAELRRRCDINGQTALSILEKAKRCIFVTEMSAQEVERFGGRKAASFQEAVNMAVDGFRRQGVSEPTFYVMPSAAYTVPFVKDESPRTIPASQRSIG